MRRRFTPACVVASAATVCPTAGSGVTKVNALFDGVVVKGVGCPSAVVSHVDVGCVVGSEFKDNCNGKTSLQRNKYNYNRGWLSETKQNDGAPLLSSSTVLPPFPVSSQDGDPLDASKVNCVDGFNTN